jgi:hypothetical protein
MAHGDMLVRPEFLPSDNFFILNEKWWICRLLHSLNQSGRLRESLDGAAFIWSLGRIGLLLLLQARLPQAVEQLSRSRFQRGILILLFLVVLGDLIEVESRAERFLKCFERLPRLYILIS